MKKIKCVICGRLVAPGARKYCMECQVEQATLDRKTARDKFYQRLDSLPTVRECVKCKEIKKHHRRVNWCVDCSKDRKAKKALEPEDALFFRLINAGVMSNHKYAGKIRQETIKQVVKLNK